MNETLTASLERRRNQMFGDRMVHEQVWREVFDYTAPERGHGFNGNVVDATNAQGRRAEIFDSTAADSLRIFGSAIASGLTPPNSRWFQLDVGQESDDERRWLDDAAQTIFENIHGSNFDAASYEALMDFGPAGWMVLYIDAPDDGGYHFEQWPLAQCAVSSSKSGGLVDTIYRVFPLTVEQCVAEYGEDGVSQTVRESFNKGGADLDRKIEMLWAIYPRAVSVAGGGARMAKNKKFASCHMEVSTRHLCRESGYDEFPCVVPRWRLIPGSSYATGPGSDALPDIKTLNQIQKLELASLDIAVAGMWKAVDDGVLNPRTVRIGPRRIVMMADINSMQPLETGSDFKVAFAKGDELRRSIRKILLADQLMLQDGPAMTATEVHARTMMIRQQLGPIFGRFQAEYLQPLIERCFAIAMRAGILGQPPESLGGRSYAVKYVSPLARAQQMEEVSAMDQFVAGQAQLMAVDPNALDIVDLDEAAREKAAALGVPSKVIRSVDALAGVRKGKADAAAQQQQAAVEQEGQVAMQGAMAQRVAAA